MKGIVFNLFDEVVVRNHGEDKWDALLDAAKLDGVCTSLGSYPDADMRAPMMAASHTLGKRCMHSGDESCLCLIYFSSDRGCEQYEAT